MRQTKLYIPLWLKVITSIDDDIDDYQLNLCRKSGIGYSFINQVINSLIKYGYVKKVKIKGNKRKKKILLTKSGKELKKISEFTLKNLLNKKGISLKLR